MRTFVILVVVGFATVAAADPPGDATAETRWDNVGEVTEDSPNAPTESVRVAQILVHGRTRTSLNTLQGILEIRTGDDILLADERLSSAEIRLRGTGYFDFVRVLIRPDTEPGSIILHVYLVDRNTFTLSGLTFGISEGLRSATRGVALPYLGMTLAETNLLGGGSRLSLSFLLSSRANGFRLSHDFPKLLSPTLSLRSSLFYNHARQYLGSRPFVIEGRCPEGDEACVEEFAASNATIFYRRGGASIGIAHHLSGYSSIEADWQAEFAELRARPTLASEVRGGETRPIDFHIEDGFSVVSALRLGYQWDSRDDAAMPRAGLLMRINGEFSHRALGSSYSYLRAQASVSGWLKLPWNHTLRVGGFVGAIVGRAPFFYRFHVSDFSDLVPSRVLDMQLDRRGAANLLGTSIEVMNTEDFAARLDVEYTIPLQRRPFHALRQTLLYGSVGVFALASERDLRTAIPGYEGFAKVPLDLTFDVGLRFDTDVGTFHLGLSTVFGFLVLE